MSRGLVPILVNLVVVGGVLAGVLVLVERSRTPERRRLEGQKWAWRHQAYVEPRWVPDVDRCLDRNRRVLLWGMCIIWLALLSVPPGFGAYVAALAALPGLVAVGKGYVATRPDYLPPGPRVARLREVSVSDYLEPSERVLMWVLVLVGVAFVLVRALRTESWVAFAALALVAAGAAVEVTGARFARMPEPAGDAAHLYWQDAMRADVLRSTAALVGGSATLTCIAVVGVSDGAHQILTLVTAAVLLTPTAILGSRVQKAPAAYVRSRLWPSLSEHQTLAPGDPLPTPGATS